MKKVKHIIGLDTKVVMPESVPTSQTATKETEQVDTSYLARQAGLQTVKTSARGILKENDSVPTRKKLLGE
nr:MAG TPA_asm: hypothetical protein [Caudoviricetes sp.]